LTYSNTIVLLILQNSVYTELTYKLDSAHTIQEFLAFNSRFLRSTIEVFALNDALNAKVAYAELLDDSLDFIPILPGDSGYENSEAHSYTPVNPHSETVIVPSDTDSSQSETPRPDTPVGKSKVDTRKRGKGFFKNLFGGSS